MSQAINVLKVTSVNDINVTGANIKYVAKNSNAFLVNIIKSKDKVSRADISLNKEVKPNIFITCRIAGGVGTNTVEIKGLNVWFLINTLDNKYMLYNSEDNHTQWKPLPIQKKTSFNTLGIYQVDRRVNFFINSKYVDSFELWNLPKSGKVGLYFKAHPIIGGTAQFEDLTVYEFNEQM